VTRAGKEREEKEEMGGKKKLPRRARQDRKKGKIWLPTRLWPKIGKYDGTPTVKGKGIYPRKIFRGVRFVRHRLVSRAGVGFLSQKSIVNVKRGGEELKRRRPKHWGNAGHTAKKTLKGRCV